MSYRTLALFATLSLAACSGNTNDELSGDADASLDGGSRDEPRDGGSATDGAAHDVADGSTPTDGTAMDAATGTDMDATSGAGDASADGSAGSSDAAAPSDASTDEGDAAPPDPCIAAQCDLHATCVHEGVGAFCVCDPGYEGNGNVCTDVATSLDGQRWELPCVADYSDTRVCATAGSTTSVKTLAGAQGKSYDVQLHFRGVVEEKAYTGGTVSLDDPHLYVGGTPVADDWNMYSLEVSSPATKLYLNNGASGQYVCYEIDYYTTIRVDAGATVTLFADPVDSGHYQIKNRDADGMPFVIGALESTPFNGQYIQVDVTRVELVP